MYCTYTFDCVCIVLPGKVEIAQIVCKCQTVIHVNFALLFCANQIFTNDAYVKDGILWVTTELTTKILKISFLNNYLYVHVAMV